MNVENNLKITKPLDFVYLIILAIFPLSLIFGNLLINFFIFLFSINFFINFKENKIFFKDKIFYLLVFFFISLVINLLFSLNPESSFPRVIKISFIIIFIFEIKRLVQKYEITYMKYIFTSWFVIFLVLNMDVLFELAFGYNLIGNKSYIPGRIASFFGDELVIGAFYHGFVLFFLSYLIFKRSKIHILIISIIFVLLISFLIGERSNFIKLFLAVTFFTSLALHINYKIKIITFLITIITLFAFLNLNESYKTRYFDQIKTLFSANGYSEYIKKSQYGAHRDTAMKIFKENLIFGVGIKNFRYESSKKKYENKEYALTNERQATHPHQIHHEFLSETGIFGYFSFLIFILSSIYLGLKSYLKSKNLYQLSAIIFIVTNLLPLLPSGSFLSTYTSGIFWINFAIMNGYIKN
tara:strand:+ start:44 stop:1276 length:1233 start_codon:yes stop_codon:yes gene_type:complete